MKFQLPATLPTTADELNALRAKAGEEIAALQARDAGGEDLGVDDVDYLTYLLDAVDTLSSALGKVAALSRAAALSAETESAEDDGEQEDGDQVDDGAEGAAAAADDADEATEDAVTAGAGQSGTPRPVDFRGAGRTESPEDEAGPGWIMVPGAPGYKPGKVGFAEMGKALDKVRSAGRTRSNRSDVRGLAARGLAQLSREMTVVDDSHALVAEIERVTGELPGGHAVTAEALVAAGGWTSPSEQLYTFCDVPNATDLISLPEIAINRGGIRWPVEPDLSAIFESFEFFFTEPELEAVDGDGNPTAFKHCVEVPAPDEFEEIRLNAVGYCVNAGILQRQGWPESIEWFLRNLTQEHLRAMSRRTINDMVAGSDVKTMDYHLQVGATSGVLNALALMATNVRLQRGLARTAPIEGVAPSWFFEVLRADLAMQQGRDSNAVTDGEINGWLTARQIALQFVGDWQTRSTGLPGHLDTMAWPATVNIMLYPAGTWFRSLSNIIEVGVLYPKDQLQINRYTEFFTEDAIAVGKRCNKSLNVTIPLKVNGGYGAPVEITYTPPTVPTTKTATITVSGTPTGGTLSLTLAGKTASVAFDAAGSAVKTALVGLDDGYVAADFTVTGGALPGTAVVVTYPAALGALTADGTSLTGGTSPDVVVS